MDAVVVVVDIDVARQARRIVGFDRIHLVEEAQQLICQIEDRRLRLVGAIQSRERIVNLLVDLR